MWLLSGSNVRNHLWLLPSEDTGRSCEKKAEQPDKLRCLPGVSRDRQDLERLGYLQVIEGVPLKLRRLMCPLQPVSACGERAYGGGTDRDKTKRWRKQKRNGLFMLFILAQFQTAPCYLGELLCLLLCNLRTRLETKIAAGPGWSHKVSTHQNICLDL